jgi:Tol biopolymer transport system component
MRTCWITLLAFLLACCSQSKRAPSERQVTTIVGAARSPVLSRDGATLVFTGTIAGHSNPQIFVTRLDRPVSPVQLTADAADNYDPSLTSDGRYIYYTSSRTPPGIYRVSVSGGPSELMIDQGFAATISPDGKTIVYEMGRVLYLRAIDGGTPTLILPGVDNSYAPIWSPNGSRLLVTVKNLDDHDPGWWIASVRGGEPQKTGIVAELRKQGFNDSFANAWLPGDWIVFSGKQDQTQTLWKFQLSADGKMQGPPVRATDDREGDYGASFAAGKLVYSRTRVDMNFWALPLDEKGEHLTGPPEPLTSGPSRKGQQSAARSKLLYSAEDGDRFSLYLKDLSTGRAKTLKDGFYSVLAPDASHFAYGEGTKDHLTVLTKSLRWWQFWSSIVCQNCGMPRGFTPDGKGLLLWDDTPPIQHLDMLDIGSRRTNRVVWSGGDLTDPRLSPDGRWVSFVAKMGEHRWQTFAAPTTTEKLLSSSEWIVITPVSDSFHFAFWSERGDIIYILTAHEGSGNLRWLEAQRVDPSSKHPMGAPWPLHEFEKSRVPGMDPIWNPVSVAGGKIILELSDVSTDIWVKDLP